MTVGAAAKAAVLAAVARALLDTGDEPGAVSMARTAIHAAESIGNNGGVAAALVALAAALAQAGDETEINRTLDLAVTYLGRVLPGARSTNTTRPVIEALVARHRFDDAVGIADGVYPDLAALAGIAAALARAGEQERAVGLAERVAADAEERPTSERAEVLVAAAEAFRAAGRGDRAESCLRSVTVALDDTGVQDLDPIAALVAANNGRWLIAGLRAAGRDAEAVEVAHSIAGQPNVRSLDAARLLSAAGLDTGAAEQARAALTLPHQVLFGNEVELNERSEAAALLPADEAVAELRAVRGAATDLHELHSRASILATVAARLHLLEPSLAADTLREALLTGWLAGRGTLMYVLATGPVADLGAGLSAQIARWIPEIDAWWAE